MFTLLLIQKIRLLSSGGGSYHLFDPPSELFCVWTPVTPYRSDRQSEESFGEFVMFAPHLRTILLAFAGGLRAEGRAVSEIVKKALTG